MFFYLKLLRARKIDAVIALADEYVFHGDLEKIIEVTYSYRDIGEWKMLNETLFEEYLWLEYPEYSIDYLWRRYKYKIQVQNVLIDDILEKTARIKICSRSESLKRWIFIDALEYVKNILKISVESIDFEMQKAGYDNTLTPAKIQKKINNIERYEKIAFGPKVIESTEEFSFCYNFVVKNHESKKKQLSQADQKIMKKCLKIIQKSSKCDLIETPDIKKKYLKWSFLKNEIIRKDYRKIFDSVCELYWLPQRTKITNAWSIYDGDNFLEIPRGDAFSCFTIERLLKLLTHEIESHYINAYNGKLLLWTFRWAKNLPKEEWLAMFMEKIFHGYSYENIDNIVEYFFTMMAWESLDWEKFEDFMRIMWKEYKCKRNYTSSVIRAKRNYSPAHVWVQHKDVVYFRWLTETLKYLQSWRDFSKLFLWKVWFHDIDNIYDIYVSYENKTDLVFPVFISDLIYYYFTEKLIDPTFEISIPEYYLYLKKKYWFIDIESFKIVEHLQNDWKKVEKIIKMFEKVIIGLRE